MSAFRSSVTRTAAVAAAAVALGTVGITAAVDASAAPATPSVAACTGSQLTVTHAQGNGATGHNSFVLRFHNTSGQACTLRGYPGLDALGKNGKVLAHAKRKLTGFAGGAKHIRTVTVRPGGVASARVEFLDFNGRTGGSCVFSKSIAVTPANTSRTTDLKVSVSICSLQIHPTVAGGSGNSRS